MKVLITHYLELLTPETMKYLKAPRVKQQKIKMIEIAELVLIHWNLVNNNYQQNSRILYTFVRNKPFGSLLEISPPNHIF